jgi:hypothetical protein
LSFLTSIRWRILKVLSFLIPAAQYFKDGSAVGYDMRRNSLSYVSSSKNVIEIYPIFNEATGELRIKMPIDARAWDNPPHKAISPDELNAINRSIQQYVERRGRPFVI